MPKRVESASSINTFFQCPRKYYYQYIEKLPTVPSIHTVRGSIAHSTLEEFYTLDVSSFSSLEYKKQFTIAMQGLFLGQWGKYREQLLALQLSQKELEFYFEETLLMLLNWCDHFLVDFSQRFLSDVSTTFQALRPQTEKEYSSDQYAVHGFIDAIRFVDDEVHIIDYKTNAQSEIKESIRLQLGIYSLLYQEKHGRAPDKIGVFFLRDRLKLLPVDGELLASAKQAILSVHAHTSACEEIKDYQRHISPLCKWKTGQCDFYAVCKPHG